MGTRSNRLLGRYEIVVELGHGAMGAVYKARDPKIDRFIAIKTIRLHQNGAQEQREFRKRFFVEAQAAGRLLHPGIVTVFDVGEDPETSDPYIVMEYIEGPTLRELLARKDKKLPLDDALRIAMDLAEALDYAHGQGVVHRDIKPANILLTKDGQAKIGDFGIAQLDLSHMTLPGRVLGTPAYMSPEQLEGQPVDGRSDLFSLGAILYSAVTGFNPFQGSSVTTVCFKVANRDPVQASTLAPELPPDLDAVIARALAKDPNERYQRGREFARDLRELRKRAIVRRKDTIWFSPSDERRTWLDSADNGDGGSPSPASSDVLKWSPPPRIARSLFASSRLIAVPVMSLFAAGLVLSFFAWRQMRTSRPAAAGIALNVKPLGAMSGAPEAPAPSPIPAVTVAQSETPVGTSTNPDAVVPPSPAAPSTSAKAKVKGATKSAPKASVAAAKASASKPSPPAASVASASLISSSFANSNLEVHIENRFAEATLSLWIDDKLAYEHPLPDGHKKRLILLGGGAKETLTIPVAAGKHALRVGVRSASEQYDQSKTVAGDFPKGGERVLSVSFDKHTRDMRATLADE